MDIRYLPMLQSRGYTQQFYKQFAQQFSYNFLQKGIKTYLFRRGEELSFPVLLKVIEESRVSVIVFSENFASSEWCLDELVKILQCKESKQQIVWPIYYKVNPLDVRDQKGSFGKALADFESKYNKNMEKVLMWRTALTEATKLPGWYFLEGHESKFIHNFVEEISVQVLNLKYLNVAKYPVGIDSHLRDMSELLGIGVNDIRMVGIWGTEGIGKTTVVKAVYNSIAHNFEGSCFLENVREKSMTSRGLVQLQNIVLSDVLVGEELEVTNVDKGIHVIKKRLSSKRVLLLLDGVDQLDQLNKLAGRSDWFGLGSRIVITTRDKCLLTAHQVDLIYNHEIRF
ncbi:disease resistance protein RPV1-like [Malus sylvestris]|uniref:disease resistance protein RPV1-like n=1 Tax=Malus sylvestris TaxID=3752 RepID=UPI0021ABF615|nr:disease resistance protein RPV1-like [Malus sylvestris]